MTWGDFHTSFFWALPLLILFFVWAARSRRKKMSELIEGPLQKQMLAIRDLRPLKQGLLVVTGVFFLLALMRPQWGYELQEVNRKGVDLMVLVDVSNSMNAADMSPNRMERAKRELKDLMRFLRGDRIGLIPFAGKAFVACPLTTDAEAFGLFLDELSTDMVGVQGTNIAQALSLAMENFRAAGSVSKAIILLSDGEATTGDLDSVMKQLKEEHVRLYVIGFGSVEGAPIPAGEESGGFKMDTEGKMVISKLDENSLKNLAEGSGGEYVRSVTGDLDLETIYVRGIKQALEDQELKSGQRRIAQERFQIPLFLGLILLLVEMLIPETRKKI